MVMRIATWDNQVWSGGPGQQHHLHVRNAESAESEFLGMGFRNMCAY